MTADPASALVARLGLARHPEGGWFREVGRSEQRVATPFGEARPAWKVLRVLGNLVEAEGFDYVTSEDVLVECREAVGDVTSAAMDPALLAAGKKSGNGAGAPAADIDTPVYSVDALVRRARALQLTPAAQRAAGGGED